MFKKIGIVQVSLLSISAIVSLRNLPVFAEAGFSIVFFLLLSSVLFFFPVSMVIAELSTTWPTDGGCYIWVKNAYGKKAALFALWASWMESVIWFPTVLVFVIKMFLFTISPFYPGIENNNFFLIFGMICIFWIITIINFFGIRYSAFFSSLGVLIGTIFPIILIILVGFFWIFFDNQINIKFDFNSFFPNFNLNSMVFFSSILLGFSGIELISFHIKDINNSGSSFIKSLFISSFLILFIYIFGSLSIAVIVPKDEICLVSGIIQALNLFFLKINFPFIIPFLSFLLFIGSLASINTWMIGPSKGLLVAAKDGFFPKYLCYVNNYGVPIYLLILQALFGSFFSVIFFIYISNINGLIWVSICLSFQFASFLYIMIFISAIKLRKSYPKIKRVYKVPFINLISFIGISSCFLTFLISYIQPSQIFFSEKNFYFLILFFSFLFLMSFPFLFIYFFNKK